MNKTDRRRASTALCLTSILALTACVQTGSTRTYDFAFSAAEATTSAAALETNGNNYRECLFAHAVLQARYLEMPVNQPRTIELCAADELPYYKSLFYSAFGGPTQTARTDFRHNTAAAAVRRTQVNAFAAAREVAQ